MKTEQMTQWIDDLAAAKIHRQEMSSYSEGNRLIDKTILSIRRAIIDADFDNEYAKMKNPWAVPSVSDYERGVIDGRNMQMKSSVDRAVNAMKRKEWSGITEDDRNVIVETVYTFGLDSAIGLLEQILKGRNKD